MYTTLTEITDKVYELDSDNLDLLSSNLDAWEDFDFTIIDDLIQDLNLDVLPFSEFYLDVKEYLEDLVLDERTEVFNTLDELEDLLNSDLHPNISEEKINLFMECLDEISSDDMSDSIVEKIENLQSVAMNSNLRKLIEKQEHKKKKDFELEEIEKIYSSGITQKSLILQELKKRNIKISRSSLYKKIKEIERCS